nr:BFH_HP1_G0043570.mRNA.1.CDS.1 [Saccharomyces cerevisiae]
MPSQGSKLVTVKLLNLVFLGRYLMRPKKVATWLHMLAFAATPPIDGTLVEVLFISRRDFL